MLSPNRPAATWLLGAAETVRIQRLFGWSKDATAKCLEDLLKAEAVGKLEDGRWVTPALVAEASAS